MQRTLIKDAVKSIGKKVKLAGWAHVRRDHGKLIFIDLRDRSGFVQLVFIPDKEAAYKIAREVRSEYIIEIEGLVKERPGGAANEKISTGRIEIEVENAKIISKPAEELPIDVSCESLDLKLETLLDNRNITLRHEKNRAIFRIYAELIAAYGEIMRKDNFVEIKTPKIVCAATEGGANFFKIDYFGRGAYLAQSPQFYKQAGVGIFERVFEIGSVFRAEPHYTTRHVNEYIGLDAEMGFIGGVEDVMNELERVMKYVMSAVKRKCKNDLEKYEAEILPVSAIPRIKLTEALKILEKEYGKKMETEDIDNEGEKLIGQWAKDNYDSDFVFLTHYPTVLRPFYSMPSTNPNYTETFDLIYRGVEIASGGQRIHDFEQMVENIKKRKLEPEQFKDYLEIFKYGMPPHGGWGLGSERIVQKLLGLKSIKEAILFPRDVKRLNP